MKISKVDFGSLLAYAPRGHSEEANMARQEMILLKNDRMKGGEPMSSYLARVISRKINTPVFGLLWS